MLQTIQKLKAAVSILVSEKKELMTRIQKDYFNHQTIFLNERDFIKFRTSKNEFMQFLERDERRSLKMEIQDQFLDTLLPDDLSSRPVSKNL